MQLINTSNGQFLDGVPNVSNGTLLTAAWCNAVQAELAAVARDRRAAEPGFLFMDADDLRDPAALRRAFILREVLGPPVGLRS